MVLFFEKWIQHLSNPLHIYCRLMDMGMNAVSSKRFGILYEKYFYHFFMRDIRQIWNFSRKGSL